MRSTASAWFRPAIGFFLTLCYFAACPTASAHPGHGHLAGFESGLGHPWSGLDHLAAMLAVGLWSAQLGGRARWWLPVVFPLVMGLGGLMGMMGWSLGGAEVGIALSSLCLGALIFGEVRARLVSAAALVGCFALFHGYAHGQEIPLGENPSLYVVGFASSTIALHLAGMALGSLPRWPKTRAGLRYAGAAISLCGALYLLEAMR